MTAMKKKELAPCLDCKTNEFVTEGYFPVSGETGKYVLYFVKCQKCGRIVTSFLEKTAVNNWNMIWQSMGNDLFSNDYPDPFGRDCLGRLVYTGDVITFNDEIVSDGEEGFPGTVWTHDKDLDGFYEWDTENLEIDLSKSPERTIYHRYFADLAESYTKLCEIFYKICAEERIEKCDRGCKNNDQCVFAQLAGEDSSWWFPFYLQRTCLE